MSEFPSIHPNDHVTHPEHYQIGIPVATKRQRQKSSAPKREFESLQGLQKYLEKHRGHGVNKKIINPDIMFIINDPDDKRGKKFEIRGDAVYLAKSHK